MISGEAYDVNFCFPVPEALETERVRLTPFIVKQFPVSWKSRNT